MRRILGFLRIPAPSLLLLLLSWGGPEERWNTTAAPYHAPRMLFNPTMLWLTSLQVNMTHKASVKELAPFRSPPVIEQAAVNYDDENSSDSSDVGGSFRNRGRGFALEPDVSALLLEFVEALMLALIAGGLLIMAGRASTPALKAVIAKIIIPVTRFIRGSRGDAANPLHGIGGP